MRDADFNLLMKQLVGAGIPARHARRTVQEVRDHYDDLVDAARERGATSSEARAIADRRLGSMQDFVAAMQSRRNLRSWPYRFPRLALLVYPLACLATLPAVPVLAGFAHRVTLARWGTSLLAAGLLTATMLLTLQLSILFG